MEPLDFLYSVFFVLLFEDCREGRLQYIKREMSCILCIGVLYRSLSLVKKLIQRLKHHTRTGKLLFSKFPGDGQTSILITRPYGKQNIK